MVGGAMCGRGYALQLVEHGKGLACQWDVHGRKYWPASGWYTSYWNAVLVKPCTPLPFLKIANPIHERSTTDT